MHGTMNIKFIIEVPNMNSQRQESLKPYRKSNLSSVSEVKTLCTTAPSHFCLFFIFPRSRTSGARAVAKFDLFKDADSGFPFILLGKSYFILFNLS